MEQEPSQGIFQWQAHPARERPGAAVLAVAVILMLAGAAFLSFGLAWSVLAGAALVISLNRFFFPSRFSIDGDGLTARHPLRRQHIRWSDARRFVHDERGGHISRRSVGSRLDAYSGVHLLFEPGRREPIVDQIRTSIDRAKPRLAAQTPGGAAHNAMVTQGVSS